MNVICRSNTGSYDVLKLDVLLVALLAARGETVVRAEFCTAVHVGLLFDVPGDRRLLNSIR